MKYYRNNNQNELFGIKLNNIAFFAVLGVILVFFMKILKAPLNLASSIGQSITGMVGENEAEKAINQTNVKTAEKTLNTASKYGQPSGADIAKAEALFKNLDGYFNQTKVAEIFGTISGKTEMNKVTSAFGIRYIIHGGVPFLRKPIKGDLPTHMGVYDIDLNKLYTRKDGSKYTIQLMLNHIA